jgi:hypothetical protein
MGKYEDEIEEGMMKGTVEKEKKHLIPNVIKEIEEKSKTNEFQKIIKQTLREASAKPKKDKWFNIFKSK